MVVNVGAAETRSSFQWTRLSRAVVVHNAEIAEMFNRLADLLEIEGANVFRVRAYRRAAQTIEDLPVSAAEMLEKGEDLAKLPGIGRDLAGKIEEFVKTGHCSALDEVMARVPASLAALVAVPGLGPKRVQLIHERLGVRSLEELAQAAREHKLRSLPRFSAKLEAQILSELEQHRTAERRFRIATAADFAEALRRHIERCPGVERVVVAGSYRRCKETVGDLDILVTCAKSKPVIEHFVGYEEVAQVAAKGSTRAAIALKAGLQADIRVVPSESYGAALHYFTGSKSHNIHIRKLGQSRGLKINEYGVFRNGKRIGGRTEEEVFAAVGLPFIEPELREDRGEIEAAQAGRLPKLVEQRDIRGDLHCHTNASDGKNSLVEMVEAARARGYEYLAITDHSKRAAVARGLDEKRLAKQLDEIDRLNDRLDGFRVLKSSEVDILVDGKLDLPDRILKRLDIVVCSIHYKFDLDPKSQTERILRAMDNRYFNILGHPTGRLLAERAGYALDLERVMRGAKERGCYLELNSHPSRLDIDDVHCKLAKDLGVLVSIGTDAHSTMGLAAMRYGIGQARRGWLEAKDILNTRPWPALKALLKR